MNSDEKAYEDLWESLLPAYPISKGVFRLPIVTQLLEIPELNLKEVQAQLTGILHTLLTEEGSKGKALHRAESAGDTHLTPLIDDEYTGVIRFDCLWNPEQKTMSVLEINCDYPDGLLLHDKTVSALSKTNCLKHETLYGQLFEEEEVVQTLHSPDAVFTDGYHAVAEYHQAAGRHGGIITDTSHLLPRTTVQRCLETSKLTAKETTDFAANSSRLINTIALRTLGYKDLLANLSHPYIPTTLPVDAASYEYCITHKDALVLKPADGCEGYGIYFGNQMDKNEWRKNVASALDKNYIAQDLIEIPKMTVELYQDGTIVEKELYYDVCPHFFIKDGSVIGAGHTLMRFSDNPIVNVSQGGGIGYYKE